jgi:hypothetical protein
MSAAAIHAAATDVDRPPRANVTAPTKVEVRPRLPTEPPPQRLPTAPERSKRKMVITCLGLAITATVAGIIVVMTTRSPAPAPQPKPAPSDPIALALYKHQAALDQCAHSGSGNLPTFARANVFVEPDGKVYDVSLEPATSNDSDVARCVREQLRAITFPSGKSRAQIVVALSQH